ncbi:hypothetical protein GCM10009133_24110 [Cocleimonas flava]|uniref:CAAX prenyl protease-like protein n=1 Tax=Cocleimonas flava TaxID=634765 RepID=A0A4V2P7S1_9GAMM|nr:CPBP family intramembrane glutamic endopeptidase [Cocleimonas flava]TCJ82945.1 CAAX prenyl protease-like protein [Cocleimonas flava]
MKLIENFLNLLLSIHKQSFSKEGGKGSTEKIAPVNSVAWDKRPAIVLVVVAFCVLLLHYLKFNTAFYATLNLWFDQFSDNPAAKVLELRRQTFFPLVTQAWWAIWHLVAFVLIPVVTIKYLLKEPLTNYGLGVGRLRRDIKWYVLLAAPILSFVVIVSFRDDFTNHYPFYKLAHRSWFDLVAWEILYLLQFVCVEFFFRGFIIQACRPTFGVNAIFVMIVPYMMIHLSKPWLEASGAIFFGLFLGVLALHTRSIWGGVAVHVSIALSMDIAALLQTKGLPQQLLP